MKIKYWVYSALCEAINKKIYSSDMRVGVYNKTSRFSLDDAPLTFGVAFASSGGIDVERAYKVAKSIEDACKIADTLNEYKIWVEMEGYGEYPGEEVYNDVCDTLMKDLSLISRFASHYEDTRKENK